MEMTFDTTKDMITFLEIGGKNLVLIAGNDITFTKIIPLLPESLLSKVNWNE